MNQSGEVTRVRKLVSYLTRRQPPTVKGTVGWSRCRIGSVMPSVACCQGYYSLVGPTRLLYYAASRILSGAL
ncbi:hypothetical protein B296_00000475 [Ensete ventricosum]|uniref:Uncharacterized protein n=1 Tax=Ensete ventricosum TaxID=4639 RepID=A0A427A2A1_ENSVE|nr:hypothetical protein B296_00000475 [Ensete ventricosum]